MTNNFILIFQVNASFVVERQTTLPSKKDQQALVPCKDVEQRMLDRTFHCAHTRGTVPALKSVKIPVSTRSLFIEK